MYKFIKKSKNQKGISLVLAVLVLSSVLGSSLVISTLVMRQGKVSRNVGISQQAYYAAEAGAEEIVYRMNQKDSLLLLRGSTGSIGDNGYWYVLEVSENSIAPELCAQDKSTTPVCAIDINNNISSSNPLFVTLNTDESFSLDMNVNGFDYQNIVRFHNNSPGNSSQLIILEENTDTAAVSQEEAISLTGNHNLMSSSSEYRKIKIKNNSGATTTYRVHPSGNNLPIGATIKVRGRFGSRVYRDVVVDYGKWQIY